MIDTHCHLYDKQFSEDIDEVLGNAAAVGVEKFIIPNVDSDTIEGMLALEKEHPNKIYAMMGLHPCSVKPENYKAELEVVKQQLFSRPFVAVGEIGIDLHWDKSTLGIQAEAFRQQIEWAIELNLPIAIHARESIDEIIEILGDYYPRAKAGVFHCFTGNKAQADKIVALGFVLGIGGVYTFKNSNLREELKDIPVEKLVLETDAPYLAPHPKRGKRNEPKFLKYILERLSDVYEISENHVKMITSNTAVQLFTLI